MVKASISDDRKSEAEFRFNVEVPETKIYNQYGSHQCNIKCDAVSLLNIDLEDFLGNALDEYVTVTSFRREALLNSQSFVPGDISRDEKLLLDVVNYDHAMCITGALVDGDKVRQFKVDNSFGRYGKYGGRLIMPESFFRNCVITVVVNRRYLGVGAEE